MSSVCRICLAGNTILNPVKNKQLIRCYEKLTNAKFDSDDARPKSICIFCNQKLLRCHTLSRMALSSEKILSNLYDRGLELNQDNITEVKLNLKQRLSVATLPFLSIDANATNVGSSVNIKDEPLPTDIDIKEEVTIEPDTLLEVESYSKDCANNQLTLKQDIGDRDNDMEELISKPHTDQFIRDDSIMEDVSRTHIKEEMTAELDKLMEIKSFPENTMKSRIKFEEDCSEAEIDIKEHLHNINVEKTKADDSKMSFSRNKCSKLFNMESKLNSHRNYHYEVKEKVVSTKKSVKDKTINDKTKKFACSVCDKTFDNKTHLIQHMKTHTDKKPFACNVCKKLFSHKDYLVEHQRTHTVSENTKSQVGLGSELAVDTQAAKMLIFLQNGEQRLITFTLPTESCTLEEVLNQVNVRFSPDTYIQCMQNSGSDIDYFVSVGLTTRIEDMLENHPMLVQDKASRSIPSVTELPRSKELSISHKANSDPVNGPKSPGQWSPLPKHVGGMLAICKSCGYRSFSFSRCERCKRVFTEEPKSVPMANTRLNKTRRNQKKRN